MDQEKEEHKPLPPRFEMKGQDHCKLYITPLNVDEINNKRPSATPEMSPYSQSGSMKPLSARNNCLCSPTTHVGSFRCRQHRTRRGFSRGGSVGSNLCDLADKPEVLSNKGPSYLSLG